MVIATFLLDELHFQRSEDERFVEWRQRLTCAEPMKDEVIPPTREGDVSTRHVHCRRKVPTIKKFAVLNIIYLMHEAHHKQQQWYSDIPSDKPKLI